MSANKRSSKSKALKKEKLAAENQEFKDYVDSQLRLNLAESNATGVSHEPTVSHERPVRSNNPRANQPQGKDIDAVIAEIAGLKLADDFGIVVRNVEKWASQCGISRVAKDELLEILREEHRRQFPNSRTSRQTSQESHASSPKTSGERKEKKQSE